MLEVDESHDMRHHHLDDFRLGIWVESERWEDQTRGKSHLFSRNLAEYAPQYRGRDADHTVTSYGRNRAQNPSETSYPCLL